MSTVTVVATVELSNVPPRVRLDVTDTGSPDLFAATVKRLDPDGRLRTVRTTDGNPLTLTTSGADRVGLLYDYEAPFGAPVSYTTEETPGTSSAEVTVEETRVWLIPPGVPTLATPVMVAKFGDRTRKVQRGVHYPMGRSTPVVQTDGARKSAEYTLSLLTMSDEERADLESVFAGSGIVLLNVPATSGFGVAAEYVAVGDITESRVTRFAGEPLRVWDLPCTVVDAPVGGTQAERTYADLLAFSSYAELNGAYASYADLLAGP